MNKPPYECKFCGSASWIAPSNQSAPADYCHPEDHGSPDANAMTGKKFDLSKCPRNEAGHYLCKTRDGRDVRILCTDRKDERPIVGLVRHADGSEVVRSWYALGRHDEFHHALVDLVNTPTKHVRYVYVWRSPRGGILSALVDAAGHAARSEADSMGKSVIAVIPVEWED